jgi:hypothetical protein
MNQIDVQRYVQRLTDLYCDVDFDVGTDAEWVLPPQKRPSSTDPRRRRRRGKKSAKASDDRFQNWYSEAMSEHVEKKKRALNGNPDDIRNAATKHAKRVSEDDFKQWYSSAIRKRDVSMAHLQQKYQEPKRLESVKFDPDKFDQWYDSSVSTWRKHHVGDHDEDDNRAKQRKQQQQPFDPNRFESWYENLVN